MPGKKEVDYTLEPHRIIKLAFLVSVQFIEAAKYLGGIFVSDNDGHFLTWDETPDQEQLTLFKHTLASLPLGRKARKTENYVLFNISENDIEDVAEILNLVDHALSGKMPDF
jgi:hypothetical protein